MPKSKTAKRKFLLPKLKLTPKSGLALVGVLICLSGAGYLASRLTHPASAALSLILCNYGGPNGTTCLNRYRGQTTPETAVIGYFPDFDSNENFEMQQLSHMCSSGYVNPNCPFTVGLGLNNRYVNDMIVQIKDLSTGKCIGNYSFDNTKTAEEKCNDLYGNNGSNGTIFVYNVAGGGGTQGYMESRYWSNYYRKPAWLCSPGYASDPRQVWAGTVTDFGNYCRWHYLNR